MGPWHKFGLAYIAYPIDQNSGVINFVESFCGKMRQDGVYAAQFDPGDAFTLGAYADPQPYIRDINVFAAAQADLVVAFLPAGVPTVGVPMEIDRAVHAGKTVVIFTDIIASWMLEYDLPTVQQFDLHNDGLNAAIEWLQRAGTPGPGSPVTVRDPLPVQVLAGGRVPTRGHDDDAGLDLYVAEDTIIPAGRFVDVPCGVQVELPEWGWGLLTGRSSTLRVKGLLVHTGIIDAGYRGPLFAGTWNQTDHPVQVMAGERIAQLIVMPNTTKDLMPVRVESLNPSERGTNGFGSTGR